MLALFHKHFEDNIIHYIILYLPFIKTRVILVRDLANVPFWEHINISITHGHIHVKLINVLDWSNTTRNKRKNCKYSLNSCDGRIKVNVPLRATV